MLSWYCLSPWRHFFMNCNACWKFCSKQEVPKTSWNHWANSDTFLIPLFFWVYNGSLFSWIIMNLIRGCRSRGCKCTQLTLFNLLDIHYLPQNSSPSKFSRWQDDDIFLMLSLICNIRSTKFSPLKSGGLSSLGTPPSGKLLEISVGSVNFGIAVESFSPAEQMWPFGCGKSA